jgi:hypothetical protein
MKSKNMRFLMFLFLVLLICGAVYDSFAVKLPDSCCEASEKCCCAANDEFGRPLREYSCTCAGGYVQWRECKYY